MTLNKALKRVETEWTEENIKRAITLIVETLKEKDKELTKFTGILNHDVKLVFCGPTTFAQCLPWLKTISFGTHRIHRNGLVGTFGYEREIPYIEKRCTLKSQVLIWLVLHEWCHFYNYKDRIKHRKSFYELVDQKYLKFFRSFFWR